jgi:GntR family transcriptional regulator/MocR family aminotransferase
MYLQLDGNGSLHAQLTRALKTAMLGGLVKGARLPSSRSLARELGLSRNTVLAAYEQLRAEGFIDGRVGSGSYIARQLPASPRGTPRLAGSVPPQSRFAARMRACHDQDAIVGRDVPGARYAFRYGVPMTNPTLTTAWARRLSQAALYTSPGYSATAGLRELREAICDYLARRRGVHALPDDVLVVGGTQQAISLIAHVLIDEGDEVAIEEPHYDAIRKVLVAQGARMRTVPVDEDGLICEALPKDGVKLVCVTPSHQFPTGAVMSLHRRSELLDYAAHHGAWIFEDDYDGEFRYDSKPLAALRSLDSAGRVIYTGTFSKALFPALRLGYLLMPSQLRRDFIAARWMADFCAPAIEQAALAGFMQSGAFERHLRRSALELKERRAVLIDGLRACSRGRLEVEDSRAGMHLVVWLPGRGDEDVQALVRHAQMAGLGLYSISPYYLHAKPRAGLLMGYGALSVAEIRQGLALFERCLDEVFPAKQAAAAAAARTRKPGARGRRRRTQLPARSG